MAHIFIYGCKLLCLSLFIVPPLISPQVIYDSFVPTCQKDTNLLDLWHGGIGIPTPLMNGIEINDNDGSEWIEILSPDAQCLDLSTRALKLKYSASTTEWRTIQLYEKTKDCHTYRGDPLSVQAMFYHDKNEVIVPLTAFRNARLKLGYAITIQGPLIINQIEFVNCSQVYESSIITAEIASMYRPKKSGPAAGEFAAVVNRNRSSFFFGGSRIIEPNDHFSDEYQRGVSERQMLHGDLTKTIFRIGYTASTPQQRQISLVCHLNPNLGNDVIKKVAHVYFLTGFKEHMDIPVVSLFGSCSCYGILMSIDDGPPIIDGVDLISDRSSPVYLITDREPVPVDDFRGWKKTFQDNRARNCHGLPCGVSLNSKTAYRNGHVHLRHSSNYLFEYLASFDPIVDMTFKCFRIQYTAVTTQKRMFILFYKSHGALNSVNTEFLFFAGKAKRILIPYKSLFRSIPHPDISHVEEIRVFGPMIIHRIDVVDNETYFPMQHVISAPALAGPSLLIDDFNNVNGLGTAQHSRLYGNGAVLKHGQIHLESWSSFLTEYFDQSSVRKVGGNAVQITYSYPSAGKRSICFITDGRHENSNDCHERQDSIEVIFHGGVDKQITIPIHLFADSKVHGLTIFGPLTLTRIKLVTTATKK